MLSPRTHARWFALVFMLSLVGGCASGPDDAVRELGEAFKKGDKLGVEARLDVPRTVTAAVDQFVDASLAQSMSSSNSRMEALGSALGGAMVTTMKPMLVRGITSGINSFASGGHLMFPGFGGSSGGQVSRDTVISAFRGVLKTETRDRLALVTIRVGRPGTDSFDVALKLEKGDGGWRVIGIDDLGPLVTKLQERTRGASLRAAARSDLRNYIVAQESYFAEHNSYASSMSALRFSPSEGVTFSLAHGNASGHAATAVTATGLTCAIFAGPAAHHALAPALAEGAPRCTDE